MHELQIHSLHLVGGDREIRFNPGFSVIKGTITSGKTTLVRLIRAMLGRVPAHLPPETGVIRSARGRVRIASEIWVVDRPLVTTQTAVVSLSRRGDSGSDSDNAPEIIAADAIFDTLRLPAVAATHSEPQTYQTWLLERIGLPEVSVPRARTVVTSPPTPVTINDWLLYCIIRDEELDTSVFGHKDTFTDRKRRAVFELIYGIYDDEVAKLEAELRSIELRLENIERTDEAVRGFLQGTPLSDLDVIDHQLDEARSSLANLSRLSSELAAQAHDKSASVGLRQQIAEVEIGLSKQERQLSAARNNLNDLADLHTTLNAQSQRLTRAIVAGEWLVDFDFMVCPRCGTGVKASRSDPAHCYLCLQEPQRGDFHDQLVKEQERIASQIVETEELIANRSHEVSLLEPRLAEERRGLDRLNEELVHRTADFVSVHSDAMASYASERTQVQADVQRLNEYRELFVRFSDRDRLRSQLEEQRADLSDVLASRAALSERSERLIRDLELRFLNYLERLHISLSDLPLTASIDRKTYLPAISNRPFDELSSQGLTVLVNVAHALAHHTVSIDHELPLPGLLVLDGLSSNVGHEGFDLARRDDTYRLLMEEVNRYQGRLQVIALDNDVPSFAFDSVVLTLTTEDRLVVTI